MSSYISKDNMMPLCSVMNGSLSLFITGGTGFVGKWLLLLLGAAESEGLKIHVTVLSRDPDLFLKSFPELALQGLDFIEGDIRDFKYPRKKYDYVIHAATPVYSSSVEMDSDEIYDIIVEGTKRVLDFLMSRNTQRLLYISSGAVYGTQPAEVLTFSEKLKCNPANAYGRGKFFAEKLCLDSFPKTIIARCFSLIGPYIPLETNLAVSNFIIDAINGKEILIKGDGTPVRSYMYGGDLAEWLMKLLLHGRTGEIYNVGSDEEVSIKALAEAVREMVPSVFGVKIMKNQVSGLAPSRYVPDISKARRMGLDVNVSLEDGISRTIDYINRKIFLSRPVSTEK